MLLNLLQLVYNTPSLITKLKEFKTFIDSVGDTLEEDDQKTLQEAYQDRILENNEGHRRLQEKLQRALLKSTAGQD